MIVTLGHRHTAWTTSGFQRRSTWGPKALDVNCWAVYGKYCAVLPVPRKPLEFHDGTNYLYEPTISETPDQNSSRDGTGPTI